MAVYLFDLNRRAVIRAIPRTIAVARVIAATEAMAVRGAMVEEVTKATITMITNPTIIASTMTKTQRKRESRRGTRREIRRSTKMKPQMKTTMARTR